MPETLFSHLFSLLFKSKNERNKHTFYFKSLLFLTLIILFFTDFYWNISEQITNLLAEDTMATFLSLVEIGLYFFSSLALLSLSVFIIAFFAYVLLDKFSNSPERIDYFRRMAYGSQFRFEYSLENILILLTISWIFNKDILIQYKSIFSENIWIIICVCFLLQFFCSSIKGILNRFFVLWDTSSKSE